MNSDTRRLSLEGIDILKNDNVNTSSRPQSTGPSQSKNGSGTSSAPQRSIFKQSLQSTADEARERRDTQGNLIKSGEKKHSIKFNEKLVEVKEVESYKHYNGEEHGYGHGECELCNTKMNKCCTTF